MYELLHELPNDVRFQELSEFSEFKENLRNNSNKKQVFFPTSEKEPDSYHQKPNA